MKYNKLTIYIKYCNQLQYYENKKEKERERERENVLSKILKTLLFLVSLVKLVLLALSFGRKWSMVQKIIDVKKHRSES